MSESSVVKEISAVEVEELRKVLIDYEEAMLKLKELSSRDSWLSGRIGRTIQIARAQGTEMLTEAREAVMDALEVYLQHFKPLAEEQVDQLCVVRLTLKPVALTNTIKRITFAINDSIPKGSESPEVLCLMFQLSIARLDQIRTNLISSTKWQAFH